MPLQFSACVFRRTVPPASTHSQLLDVLDTVSQGGIFQGSLWQQQPPVGLCSVPQVLSWGMQCLIKDAIATVATAAVAQPTDNDILHMDA